MSEEIKHGFIPVKEIFTNKWYKIPEYQRPYVWGKEQIPAGESNGERTLLPRLRQG